MPCEASVVSFAFCRCFTVLSTVCNFDLFNQKLIAPAEIGVFTAAVGTGPAVGHGRIFLPAVLAEGDCVDLLDFQFCLLHHRFLFPGPVPAVDKVIVDNTGHLTDLQGDGGDLFHIVFLRHLFYVAHDVEYHSQFVHSIKFLIFYSK